MINGKRVRTAIIVFTIMLICVHAGLDAAELCVAEPGAAELCVAEPDAAELRAAELDAAELCVAEPDVAELCVAEPGRTGPCTAGPGTNTERGSYVRQPLWLYDVQQLYVQHVYANNKVQAGDGQQPLNGRQSGYGRQSDDGLQSDDKLQSDDGKQNNNRQQIGNLLQNGSGQQKGNGRQNGSEQQSDQPRSIYIGDLITIEVVSGTTSREELKEKFNEFEIVDLEETDKGFLVTVRSFVPGEKTVNLGDKEIVIIINSALADIQREDVFEGNTNPEGASFAVDWRYPFFVLLAVFLTTGALLLYNFLKKRQTSRLDPYNRFIRRTKIVQFSDCYYFAKLTMYFKEYIESIYNISIRGKTTGEIMDSINVLPGLKEMSLQIENWLKESDYYKFSGVVASNERKQLLLDELVEIVNRIEREKESK